MFFTILIATIILTYLYFKYRYHTETQRGIPYVPPTFPCGSSLDFLIRRNTLPITISKLYNNLKQQKAKLGMFFMYSSVAYIPIHPDVTKQILSKDFLHFTDHGVFYNEEDDPLSAHLFALEGAKWRSIRTKLTPTFTSGKMKMMYPLLEACGKVMVREMKGMVSVDIKDYFSRFATDVIGTCAFGLECNSYEDDESEFRKMSGAIFETSLLQAVKRGLAIAFPGLIKVFRWTFTPKHVEEFFTGIIKDTVGYRREKRVVRNDFLQLLMDIQEKEGLSFEEMCAQSFVFFIAGFETSSTLVSFCLHELAKDEDLQNRVREEIREAFDGKDDVSYEAVHDLKLLGCVLEETLRKYPPVGFLARRCTKDWTESETGADIKKGQMVFLPVYGFHHDPDYFPNPEKFDPDRFNAENKQRIVPFTYLPFGEGPRVCIGQRFGMMQSRLGIALLLNKYKFTLNSNTKSTLIFRKDTVILQSKDPIILDVEEL